MTAERCELLITGGRLVDPAHGVDEVTAIGITGGRIVHRGPEIEADRVIDASSLVVAPGFIDLHSHAQDLTGHRLQALDGVTTSLELESGATPIAASKDWAATGRPLNSGYSAGWLHARMIVMEGLDEDAVAQLPALPLGMFAALQHGTRWQLPATSEEVERIVALTAAQLDAGAIGIGVLLGYAPETGADELEAIARLAAEREVPLFVHARYGSHLPEHTPVEGVAELLELCRSTGVRIHQCHFASTNASTVAESAALIRAAQAEGLPFTTESYPFGLASTVVGAAFLSPESMAAGGGDPRMLTIVATGEQVSSLERLAELRAEDPGALCLIRYYDEADPEQLDGLVGAVLLEGAAFASDAMPVSGPSAGIEPPAWPPAADLAVHPRSTSCFTRALAWLHRDTGRLSLSDVIERSTVIPAQVLAGAMPAIADKGHLGLGADADVVMFDLNALEPRTRVNPVEPSAGVRHLLVGGVPVVAEGELIEDALPGQVLEGAAAPREEKP